MKAKTRFWLAFAAILIFSAILSQLILDNKMYMKVSISNRNFIELAAVTVTGLLGHIYFYRPRYDTLKKLWLLIYGASVVFLLAATITDNYIYRFSTAEGLHRFGTLKEFLISPLLFIIFTALETILKKQQKP
jgi:hypothetical protein